MDKVYIVEIQDAWSDTYDISAVFTDKEKALDYAASYMVDHWSHYDELIWEDEMEESGKFISKLDYAKELAENGESSVRVGEYDLM